MAWVNRKHSPCSLGLFTDLDSAKALLSTQNKLVLLPKLAGKGKLISDPLPESLAQLLG